jgi:hypothetical protein
VKKVKSKPLTGLNPNSSYFIAPLVSDKIKGMLFNGLDSKVDVVQ